MATTLDQVDGVDIVSVRKSCTYECAKKLGPDVDWDLSPWEIAPHSEGEGDGRVNVTARHTARYPNPQGGR